MLHQDYEFVNNVLNRNESIPIADRLSHARFIIHDTLKWSSPTKTYAGYVEYIDDHGDFVRAYGDSNKEVVEVYGFNIISQIQRPNERVFFHSAFLSYSGLIIKQIGATWYVADPSDISKSIIHGAHHLAWIKNKIYGTLGAGVKVYDVHTVTGKLVKTPKLGTVEINEHPIQY